MATSKTIKTKVVGVTFEGRQRKIKKYVRSGKSLILAREPDNPHSKTGTATSVWVKPFGKRRVQIGYLASEVAQELAPLLAARWRYNAVVLGVTGGTRKKRTRGVNIRIYMESPGHVKSNKPAQPPRQKASRAKKKPTRKTVFITIGVIVACCILMTIIANAG